MQHPSLLGFCLYLNTKVSQSLLSAVWYFISKGYLWEETFEPNLDYICHVLLHLQNFYFKWSRCVMRCPNMGSVFLWHTFQFDQNQQINVSGAKKREESACETAYLLHMFWNTPNVIWSQMENVHKVVMQTLLLTEIQPVENILPAPPTTDDKSSSETVRMQLIKWTSWPATSVLKITICINTTHTQDTR